MQNSFKLGKKEEIGSKSVFSTKFYSTMFDILVVSRMLSILREHGHIRRTNLAGKTGLNYKQCVKYVNLLMLLGWARVIFDNGSYVSITEKGIEILTRLTSF